MAIPFLNNIDLLDNKLENFVVDHSTTANAGDTAGKLIYDSGSLKYYNGSSWQTLGTGSGSGTVTQVGVTDGYLIDSSGGPITSSGNITIDVDLSELTDMTQTITTSDEVVVNDVSETGKDQGKRKAWSEIISDLSILTGTIGTAELAADAVTAAKLADTAVTADSYTNADITVDAQGRITAAASGTIATAEIEDDAVTYAKIQNVSATDRILGRDSAGAGVIEEISPSSLRTMINVADGANNYSLDLTKLNAVTSAMTGDDTLTFGDSGNDTSVIIKGDLQVDGTTTTVNSTTVNLNDHNIVLDTGNTTSAVIDGAGITLEGGTGSDASFTYSATNAKWELKLGSSYENLQVDQLIAASLDISGNVDVDGTLEADAITVNGSSLQVVVEDHVGAMLDGTETGITVSYDATDNNIDFVVDSASESAPGIIEIADSGEAQIGTSDTVALTPAKLADRMAQAVIDVSSINTSHKKAVINHALGSDSLIVSCFDDSTKENVICSFSMENNGTTTTAARNNYLTFHFDNIPSNDIIVNIMTVEGSSVKTPTYPTS